jgi:hypothetical protein
MQPALAAGTGRMRCEAHRCVRARCAAPAVTAPPQLAPEDDVVQASFPAPAPGLFTPNRASFSEEHRIRGYEVQPNQRANIVTVANLLQVRSGAARRAAAEISLSSTRPRADKWAWAATMLLLHVAAA